MFILDLLAAIALIYTLYRYARNQKSCLPLPPGLKKLPLVGNLFGLPRSLEWEVYDKWSKELNTDVLHLNAAGTHIIVLGSHRAAVDLLEKRSSIYSGRPRLPMVVELMGWDFNFGFMDYGERTHRRLMHDSFHPSAAKRFRPQELRSARDFLRRLLDDQSDMMGELRQLSGEAILSSTYGLKIASKHDKFITIAKAGIDPVVPALIPGTFLVDILPALKYVPEWFPGASFKRKAKEWRRLALEVRDTPFEQAKREIEKGSPISSFCSNSLSKLDIRTDIHMQEEDIKSVAGTLYGGTKALAFSYLLSLQTMGAVASCLLALLNHPSVLKKAQEEIDRVIKPGHLPDFDDEPSLPYVAAVVKESMRWRPTAPLALPHTCHAEDEYNGYRIPKGSIILANAWAMLHDESIYPDPFSFRPERFLVEDGRSLNKEVKDPGHAIWGFGRRICPGRYMAASSIWIAVVSFIAAFDFNKVDESGGLDHGYDPGIIRIPHPFKCSIRPRNKEVEDFIRSTEIYG
ncbi:cytochrome P450 [Gymnopilus junonius]|uniref:Cytochrome P450 n=1 Tax=Gymnopilus junonius TaxID=109634 RepID=A0A9P5TRG5_GYMJU|nr:cytochrome P450 [Gymnopilus junonius]